MDPNWCTLLEETMKILGDTSSWVAARWGEGDIQQWRQGEPTDGLDAMLAIRFNDDFGMINGVPFILWTERYVYFPATLDGGEWVDAMPLSPDVLLRPYHVGGAGLSK